MRTVKWLGAAGLLAVLACQASAQNAFFGPRQPLQFQQISTPDPNTPIASPMNASGRTGFKLMNYLPGRTLLSNKRVIGTSNFPTPSQMPGKDYLKAFKYGRGVSVMP